MKLTFSTGAGTDEAAGRHARVRRRDRAEAWPAEPLWPAPDPARDREILLDLASGEPGAATRLYDAYAARLHDYAASVLREGPAADVVHDVLVDAARRAARVRDRELLGAWLYGATRARLRRRTFPRPHWDWTTAAGDPRPPVPHKVRDALDHLMAVTGPTERELLLLTGRHGLTCEDLEAVLGRPARQLRRRCTLAWRRAAEIVAAHIAASLPSGGLAATPFTPLKVQGSTPPNGLPYATTHPAAPTGMPYSSFASTPDGWPYDSPAPPAYRPMTEAAFAAQARSSLSATSSAQPQPAAPYATPTTSAAFAQTTSNAPLDTPAPSRASASPYAAPNAPFAASTAFAQTPGDAPFGAHASGGLSVSSSMTGDAAYPAASEGAGWGAEGAFAGRASGDAAAQEAFIGGGGDPELRVEALLVAPFAPAPSQRLRMRVLHTLGDPELAPYRAEISARGGRLTPEGLPRQTDATSPVVRRTRRATLRTTLTGAAAVTGVRTSAAATATVGTALVPLFLVPVATPTVGPGLMPGGHGGHSVAIRLSNDIPEALPARTASEPPAEAPPAVVEPPTALLTPPDERATPPIIESPKYPEFPAISGAVPSGPVLPVHPPALPAAPRHLLQEVPRVVPDVVRSLPQVVRNVPQVIQDVPKVVQDVPRVVQDVPRVVQDVPRIVQNVPQTVQDVPRTLQDVPAVVRDVPGALSGLTGTPGQDVPTAVAGAGD